MRPLMVVPASVGTLWDRRVPLAEVREHCAQQLAILSETARRTVLEPRLASSRWTLAPLTRQQPTLLLEAPPQSCCASCAWPLPPCLH